MLEYVERFLWKISYSLYRSKKTINKPYFGDCKEYERCDDVYCTSTTRSLEEIIDLFEDEWTAKNNHGIELSATKITATIHHAEFLGIVKILPDKKEGKA